MPADKKPIFSPHTVTIMKLRQVLSDIELLGKDLMFVTLDRGKPYEHLLSARDQLQLCLIILSNTEKFP